MENVGEQINSVINNLADKLGVAAERLYPVLIKQVYVNAVQLIVVAFIGLILLVSTMVAIRMLAKKWWAVLKEKDDKRYQTMSSFESRGLAIFFVSFTGLIGSLMTFIPMAGIIGRFINPDWYAIKMILDKVTGGN